MERIAENVYIEKKYDGVNVGAILTTQGIIAVDVPSYPRQARDWAMRLRSLSPRPLLFTILTDYNGDRILNSRWLNAPIAAHQITADKIYKYGKHYPSHILESLTARHPLNGRNLSSTPVDKPAVSFTRQMSILKGNTDVVLTAAPGPTTGNLWVYLPRQKILFAGDTVTTDWHPLFLEGTSKQWLETLNRLQQWPERLHTIVSGRGGAVTDETIPLMQCYLHALRSRIQQHIHDYHCREEIAQYIPDLLDMFPLNGLPADWLRSQIKRSLDHVYDEIQLEKNKEEATPMQPEL
ncbi:MAG: MBL fold metallo-hydrolase [Chloroflexi bacterium]|nr:MBL fold metallo-hydrolase [Chloroflexota bacterium]